MTFVGPIALSIPLYVTLVVCVVARREGTRLPKAALLRLVVGTVIAVAASLFFAHPIAILVAALALFAILAIPVMRALERAARERLVAEPLRTAGLVPRTVGTYVPLWARGATVAAGLALLGWGSTSAAASPQLITFTFAFAGLTFFGLYEVWMRQEVLSVRAESEEERRVRVRGIFGAQTLLTLSFLLLAGLSAGDRPTFLVLSAVASLIGAAGCALALSTGIQERYLRAWSVKR